MYPLDSMLKEAIKHGYIELDSIAKNVTYLPHRITRPLVYPEEQVQLKIFLSLIYNYGYPADRIRVSCPIKMGSSLKEADIVVYADNRCTSVLIIVECKRKGISDIEFSGAIDQGFSYASACMGQYVWATDGEKNAYFEVYPNAIGERTHNKLSDIPKADIDTIRPKNQSILRNIIKAAKWFWSKPINRSATRYTLGASLFVALFSHIIGSYIGEIGAITRQVGILETSYISILFHLIIFFSLLAGIISAEVIHILPQSKQDNPPSPISMWQKALLAAILCIPAWIIGGNFDANWWTIERYHQQAYGPWILLWPFIISIPAEIILVITLLWIRKED